MMISRRLFRSPLDRKVLIMLLTAGLLALGITFWAAPGRIGRAGIDLKLFDSFFVLTSKTEGGDVTPTVTESSRTKKVKLIILTYMRSGSTFTGDLFNHHSRVFYFYEPLWMLDFHFNEKEPALFFAKAPMAFSSSDPLQKASLQNEVMNATLGCRFEYMCIQPLQLDVMPWSKSKSRSVSDYVDCIRSHAGINGILDCLPILRKACVSADVIVVKTVRFTMKQAAFALKGDPKVKVIHLIRDPRGNLRSLQRSQLMANVSRNQIEAVCSRIHQDLKDSERLKRLYPGRILTARYEDLAQKPIEFATRLLDFAELDLEPELAEYIYNITASRHPVKAEMFNTIRQDSQRTASQWRRDLTFDVITSVDALCGDVYRYMGFLVFHNESVQKNTSLLSYRPWEEVSGLWSH